LENVEENFVFTNGSNEEVRPISLSVFLSRWAELMSDRSG
jgi:hypothetical protein